VLPHITLPLLFFGSLYSPPFRHRGILFSTLILLNVYACIYDDVPSARQARYGLAAAWFFYLPLLEKLLLHHDRPEHDFWRLDRAPREAEAMAPFSWDKAVWAVALFASPRGVGWSHQSSKLPVMANPNQHRAKFVAGQMVRIVAMSCAIEATNLIFAVTGLPSEWSWEGMPRIALAELLMAVIVYSSWTFQYSFAAAMSVGLGLTKPKDWPPLFGSLTNCTSLGGFWGGFWQGMLRQPALAISHAIVDGLRVKKKSMMAYAIHLVTAFFISGLGHVISIAPICDGVMTIQDVWRDSFVFFMAQAMAVVAENVFISLVCRPASGSRPDKSEKSVNKHRVGVRIGSLAGYAWTFAWLMITGWWFVRLYVRLGAMEWTVPVPIVAPALRLLGELGTKLRG
jgi:hypothetical protein